MPIDIPGFAYAAAVAAGGIMGYVKSQSLPSLGAGILFGSILGYGAFQSSQDPQHYGTILGSSAVLGGMMGYRFYNTGKIMPAGLIAAVSAVMVVRYSLRVFSSSPVKVHQ